MNPTDKANDYESPAPDSDAGSSRGKANKCGDTDLQRKDKPAHVAQDAAAPGTDLPGKRPDEHGGQNGLDPTRYGDWEKKGRCTDF